MYVATLRLSAASMHMCSTFACTAATEDVYVYDSVYIQQNQTFHYGQQCCGNYRSEIIDYNYDYFSLKMPNWNFNY